MADGFCWRIPPCFPYGLIKFLSRNFGFEKAVFCMDDSFLKDWYADGNMDERVRTGT